MDSYREKILSICQPIVGENLDLVLDVPSDEFGDISTNIALQAAKLNNKNPRQLATELANKLTEEFDEAESVSIAGPGFINIKLKNNVIFDRAISAHKLPKPLHGKVVVAEYSDPNPFKVLHAGHLYTSLVGDAIANIEQAAGAKVHRLNFGGDVGLHVAKTMWAIIKELGGEVPEKLADVEDAKKLDWLSQRYTSGNEAYEEDDSAKQEIVEINKRVYLIHENEDKTSPFAQIYWTCRQWSYDGFDELYARLRMQPFEKYYPESLVAQPGLKAVKKGLENGVFKKSDGAVVFDGEAIGLHTRVFINSEGLPTYEAKDLGLSLAKWDEYKFDKSLIITGNDIDQYMKVVVAAVRHFEPKAAERTVHRTHGQIKLAGGQKMSSRKGNILRASDILDAATSASQKIGNTDDQVVLGAIRYSFLKGRLGGDIIYDPEESVGLEGNSGPYIQYALVRAKSILAKAQDSGPSTINMIETLEPGERSLARAIAQYPDVFNLAVSTYSPHHICNYLYELAQKFNSFYEANRVVGHERQDIRLALVGAYIRVLNSGLDVLGMPKPEKM